MLGLYLNLNIGTQLFLVGLTYGFGRYVSTVSIKTLARSPVQIDATAARFIGEAIYFASFALGGLSAVNYLGMFSTSSNSSGSVVGSFAMGGVILGLGSQKILSQFISGLILLTLRPFSVGDRIECNGVHGWVIEIGVLYTFLNTLDHVRVVMANDKVLNAVVKNHTHLQALRMDFVVQTSRSHNEDIVRQALKEALERISNFVLADIICEKMKLDKDNANSDQGRISGGIWSHGVPINKMPESKFMLREIEKDCLKWVFQIWVPTGTDKKVKDHACSIIMAALFEIDAHGPVHNIQVSMPVNDTPFKFTDQATFREYENQDTFTLSEEPGLPLRAPYIFIE